MTSPTSDRYRRLSASFDRVLEAVPAERWDDPSPCEGWSARDVVEHVVTTQADFLGRQPFAPDPPLETSNPLTDWPIVRDLVQAALDEPASADHAYDGYFGPTTFAESIDAFYSADLAIHAWDIATATGLESLRSIEPADLERMRAGFEPLADNMRQPGLFAAAVEVDDDADEQTRFLAFVGRRA